MSAKKTTAEKHAFMFTLGISKPVELDFELELDKALQDEFYVTSVAT